MYSVDTHALRNISAMKITKFLCFPVHHFEILNFNNIVKFNVFIVLYRNFFRLKTAAPIWKFYTFFIYKIPFSHYEQHLLAAISKYFKRKFLVPFHSCRLWYLGSVLCQCVMCVGGYLWPPQSLPCCFCLVYLLSVLRLLLHIIYLKSN